MANTIRIRRSATAAAVPTTAQLALGELAVNTTDGKLFLKKNVSGSESIVEVGAPAAGSIVDATISATAEIAVSKLADGAARQLLQTDALGTGVEWTNNVDIPGTLDVTNAATFDSTVSVPLGTAALPSFYPGTDANTGLWSPGADTLAVSTAGSERLRITSTGNVGIGATPTEALQVANGNVLIGTGGSLAGYRTLYFGATSASGRFAYIEKNNDSPFDFNIVAQTSTTASSAINFKPTPTSTAATIDSSGRLLVGTGSVYDIPSGDGTLRSPGIQRAGTTYAGSTISAVLFNATAPLGGGTLHLGRSNGASLNTEGLAANDDVAGTVYFSASDGVAQRRIAQIVAAIDGVPAAGDMPGRIVFSTTADGTATPTERMRISSAGFVGINNLSPGSTLDVKGTLRLSGATSGFVGLAPAAAAGSTTYTLPTADGSSGQFLSTNGSGVLSWATGGGGGGGSNVFTQTIFPRAGTATAGTAPISFTSGPVLTSREAGTLEYDGTFFYATPTFAGGRGHAGVFQTFRLTADGANVGPSIGNFFGSNSAVVLAANATYELNYYLIFIKNTAGNLTWQLAASNATRTTYAIYRASPVNGTFDNGQSVGSVPTTGFVSSRNTNNATFNATALHSAGAWVTYEIFARVVVGAFASNLRLNVTNSAGSVTPLLGSYYTSRQVSNTTGTFAA